MSSSASFGSIRANRETPSKEAQSKEASSVGFTLIELLVVITIVCIASAVVVFSIRPSESRRAGENAEQLAAVLDSVRGLARAQSSPITWQCDESGITVQGALPYTLQTKHYNWQNSGSVCDPKEGIIGPEPITRAQSIYVYAKPNLDNANVSAQTLGTGTGTGTATGNAIQIRTNGLGPYKLIVTKTGNQD